MGHGLPIYITMLTRKIELLAICSVYAVMSHLSAESVELG